jgi:hypothetical protein
MVVAWHAISIAVHLEDLHISTSTRHDFKSLQKMTDKKPLPMQPTDA